MSLLARNTEALDLLNYLNSLRVGVLPLYFDHRLTENMENFCLNSVFPISLTSYQLSQFQELYSPLQDIDVIVQQKPKIEFLGPGLGYFSLNKISEKSKKQYKDLLISVLNERAFVISSSHISHCHIHLFENDSYIALIISISRKNLTVDSISQIENSIRINGWINSPRLTITRVQINDTITDQQYSSEAIHFQNPDNYNSDYMTPLLSIKPGSNIPSPIIYFFGLYENQSQNFEQAIYEIEYKQLDSTIKNNRLNPLYEQMNNLSRNSKSQDLFFHSRIQLQEKLKEIQGQKNINLEVEAPSKQLNKMKFGLEQIEESNNEFSSAKPKYKFKEHFKEEINVDSQLDEYTNDISKKYLLKYGLDLNQDPMQQNILPISHQENNQPQLKQWSVQPKLPNWQNNDEFNKVNLNNLSIFESKENNNHQFFQQYQQQQQFPILVQPQIPSQQSTFYPQLPAKSEEQKIYLPIKTDEQKQYQDSNISYNCYHVTEYPIGMSSISSQPQMPDNSLINQPQSYPFQQQDILIQQQIQNHSLSSQLLQMQQQYNQQLISQQLQSQSLQFQMQLSSQQKEVRFSSITKDKLSTSSSEGQPLSEGKVPKFYNERSNQELRKKSLHRLSLKGLRQSSLSEKERKRQSKHFLSHGCRVLNNLSDFQVKFQDLITPFDFSDLKSQRAQKRINLMQVEIRNQSFKFIKEQIKSFANPTLYNDTKFSDFSFMVNGKLFRSHRTVLAQVSPYFRQNCSPNSSEMNLDGGIDEETFRLFLKFIYCGKLNSCDWQEISLQKAEDLFDIGRKFEVHQLLEQLVVQVIIPKMQEEKVLHWCWIISNLRRDQIQFEYILNYLFNYLKLYFAWNCKPILKHLRNYSKINRNKKDSSEFYSTQFQKLQQRDKYQLIMSGIQRYKDQETMNNLLWLLGELQDGGSLFKQLLQMSKPHAERRSFKFKYFDNEKFECFVNAQPYEAFLIPMEPPKNNLSKQTDVSSTQDDLDEFEFIGKNQVPEDNLLSQTMRDYELKVNLNGSISNYKFLFILDFYKRKVQIISQCFPTQSAAWRLILEIDDEFKVSLYVQDRGAIQNNVQFFNLDHFHDDLFCDTYSTSLFLSVFLRIEGIFDHLLSKVFEQSVSLAAKQLYHSFPTQQFYSVGFANLFTLQQTQKTLHIKVWIQEDSIHSAIMTNLCQHFSQYKQTSRKELMSLNYCDLFSLFSSDLLDIKDETELLYLLSETEQAKELNERDAELLIYPIRFIYIQPDQLFKTIQSCEIIKQKPISRDMVYKYICWKQGDNIPAFADLKPRKKYLTPNNQSKGKRMKSIRMEIAKWFTSEGYSTATVPCLEIYEKKEEIIKMKQIDEMPIRKPPRQIIPFSERCEEEPSRERLGFPCSIF